MSLLDLKTDLKSLKFGTPPASDRPGGGNSGQPYITNPISSDVIPQSEDFLLRGGLNAPLDAANDVVRLTKMFGDLKSPSGILFVAKQNLLSRIAVNTQASGKGVNEGVYTPLTTLAQAGVGFAGGHLSKQGLNPLSGVKTYGPKSLFNPQGSTVIGDVIGEPDGTGNRLVGFYNDSINTDTKGNPILYSYAGGPNSDLGIGRTDIKFSCGGTGLNRTGINNPKLKNSGFFSSPPTSSVPSFGYVPPTNPTKYGFDVFTRDLPSFNPEKYFNLGSATTNPNTVTNKYRSSLKTINSPISSNFTEGLDDSPNSISFITTPTSVYKSLPDEFEDTKPSLANSTRINDNGTLTLDQKQINEQLPKQPNKFKPGSVIQDFRAPLLEDKKPSTIMSLAPSYKPNEGKTKAIDGVDGSRINMTSPGQQGNILNYSKGKIIGSNDNGTGGRVSVVDHINFQPLYKSTKVREDTTIAKNDLVKFRIGAVLRDGEKVFMHFRAFIDQFSDSYGAKWNGIQYMGRGEEFYKYGGFSRKISLSYTVAAQSKPEIMAQYKKLNFLASTLAPDYGDSGYMGGVLTTLTLGGWCYELPGFIDSLTLDIPQESPWEIGIDDKGEFDPTVKEMPHICKVTMNFTPIHTFRPELQKNDYNEKGNGEVNKYGNQHYIGLTTSENPEKSNYKDIISLADAQKLK